MKSRDISPEWSIGELASRFDLVVTPTYVPDLVNATLVCLAASIHYWMNPLRVIRQLRVGRLSEFVTGPNPCRDEDHLDV